MTPLSELLKTEIPFLSEAASVVEIQKGYSYDKKFVVHLNGERFLLRTFNKDQIEIKKNEFDILQKMKDLDVKCSRPLKFGSLQDLNLGYMLLTYIDGNDAGDELPLYSESEQYAIGVEAGKQLRQIHQLHAPAQIASWFDRKSKKHQQYIEDYRRCGIQLKHDNDILLFIEDHMKLLKHLPNMLQHDDFHVWNIIVRDKAFAGVIDFDRYDWGDPIHDFLKVGFFSSEVSIPFSIGQISGYFNQKQPTDSFWQLYAVYIAMCVISSIVWIMKVKPQEVDVMLEKIYRVLDDHDYFQLIKPKWYKD